MLMLITTYFDTKGLTRLYKVGVKHVQLQNVVHYVKPVLLTNFEVDIKHVYVIIS